MNGMLIVLLATPAHGVDNRDGLIVFSTRQQLHGAGALPTHTRTCINDFWQFCQGQKE